ncbi:MAG: GGDEF domain-containing protein [Bacilli bacterium]|nr:GGDEF domain-containing protein [Bacilli bacterium]
MPYSVFVIVALTIHILINIVTFIKKDNVAANKQYRMFVVAIAAFYLTDILWGIFESNKNSVALYVDTIIYFLMMGATIWFWTHFIVNYLEGNKAFSLILRVVGALFFLAEVVLLIVNIFVPTLFSINENAVYTAYPTRDIMLWLQIGMYALITIYCVVFIISKKVTNYMRYIGISLFGAVMIACIAVQLGDPYIPFYSIGCLIGVCILSTFALNDSKEALRNVLQEKEKLNEAVGEKLDEVLTIAYRDPLTGVKNRYAYVEAEEKYDKLIEEKRIESFSVAVFDLNNLKNTNDSLGHDAGDALLVEATKLITSHFHTENIYRFGGDEFVAILEGEEQNQAKEKYDAFLKLIDENAASGGAVIASGIARFKPDTDNTLRAVFYRADKMMYARKEYLKERY